jgi:hypothetical protein
MIQFIFKQSFGIKNIDITCVRMKNVYILTLYYC